MSFNGNKIITTGAGGAILTNSKILYEKVKELATLAKNKSKIYDYISVGYNYRMASINASLGLSQLKDINRRILKRRKLYENYNKLFNKVNGMILFSEPKNTKSNYWSQLLILKNIHKDKRANILNKLNKNKIESIQGWNLLNNLNYLKKFPKSDLSNSKKISKTIINLPSLN